VLKTILFDIDNTLILFNEQKFMGTYLSAVYERFADMMPQKEFIERIITATKAVSKNRGELPNDQYFLKIFANGREWPYKDIWERFDKFYDTYFDSLKSMVKPAPGVKDILSVIEEQGLSVVLASNPLWPEKIQLMRALWAGLNIKNYAFVSHITNMNYCKPDVQYFRHICTMTNTPPDQCLMIGNDEIQDMAAARIGMKTFLVLDGREFNEEFFLQKDHEQERGNIPDPDFSGSLKDAAEVINKINSNM